MKQTLRLSAFFLLLTLVALSCSDQNIPVDQEGRPSSGNNAGAVLKPSNSGPIVIRSETAIGWFYVDERRGISASVVSRKYFDKVV